MLHDYHLVLNGEFDPCIEDLKKVNEPIIAVDGGINHLRKVGISPWYYLGDGDSGLPEGKKILFPVEKDFSDAAGALKFLESKKPRKVCIYCWKGKRTDHFLFNIFMVNFTELYCVFKSSKEIIYLVSPNYPFKKSLKPGTLLSIFPFQKMEGVITKGLKYSLNKENIVADSRTLSNVCIEEKVEIKCDKGKGLVIVLKT